MNRNSLTVAVVGATGVVGRTMIQVLNEREFPVGELRLLASGRSAGQTVFIDGLTLEIGEAPPEAFDGVDIALFSAGGDVSMELAPAAVAHGATVIDNSSAWRMDPSVPLVVSQVNPDDLEGHAGIVANPEMVRSQFEGAAVFGTSIARTGEITATKGAIDQSNFNDYQLARMNDAPRQVDIHIVESNAPPAGVGEPGVPPFVPALCNAVFAATGKRVRELPLTRNGFS